MSKQLSDRHIAWIVYQKMITKVKPSKKVYNRAKDKRISVENL